MKWSQRESDPHSQTASLVSSRWTMAPWGRRMLTLHHLRSALRIRANLGDKAFAGRGSRTSHLPSCGTGVTRTRIPSLRTRCLPFGRRPHGVDANRTRILALQTRSPTVGRRPRNGRSGEFCHPGLLIPNQALFYLSYTPSVWGDRRDLNSLGRAVTAHGLDSSPSITMVGTEGVEPFVCRLSSGCTEPLCYVPSSPPFLTTQGEGAIKLASLVIPFGDGVSRGGEFCHLDLPVPGRTLFYLSYTPLLKSPNRAFSAVLRSE